MINLHINYSLKADQSPELNAAFVASFIEALAAKGHAIHCDASKPVKALQFAKEKGPLETMLLANTGKSRMKVPSSWEGSREEWAQKLLTGETPTENEDTENNDPMAVFHD